MAFSKRFSSGGIILNDYNELVVVFTDTKSWQFPKGTVEKGEKYFNTAVRGIEEETGLKDLQFIEKLPMYTRICRDKKSYRDIHYFFFNTIKQPLLPSAGVQMRNGLISKKWKIE